MKKKIIIGAVVAVLVIICGVVLFKNNKPGNSIMLDVYFFDSEISTIVPERQTLSYDGLDDMISRTVERMIKGSKKNTNVMDAGTKINSVEKKGSLVTVDFSNEFLTDDKTKNTLAVYAVVKTLCQIPGVGEVLVTVGGKNVDGADGSKIEFLSGDDINIERGNDGTESKTVVLYFKDGTNKLSQTIRTIKITDTLPIEQYIVNELIKGPEYSELGNVIASDTTLISAQTTDGTCFVNFGSNFVSKNSESDNKIAVYAIVNSLTELDTVKNVQFLVDGKKISGLGDVSLSGTLSRKEDIINN